MVIDIWKAFNKNSPFPLPRILKASSPAAIAGASVAHVDVDYSQSTPSKTCRLMKSSTVDMENNKSLGPKTPCLKKKLQNYGRHIIKEFNVQDPLLLDLWFEEEDEDRNRKYGIWLLQHARKLIYTMLKTLKLRTQPVKNADWKQWPTSILVKCSSSSIFETDALNSSKFSYWIHKC